MWRVRWERRGRPVRIFGVNQDITTRRQAEEALRESEMRLTMALRVARMGYWRYDFTTQTSSFSDYSTHYKYCASSEANFTLLPNREILSDVLGLDPDQPFLDWKSAHGVTGTAAADPDHDGVPLLVEFACGLDPAEPGPPPWTVSPRTATTHNGTPRPEAGGDDRSRRTARRRDRCRDHPPLYGRTAR